MCGKIIHYRYEGDGYYPIVNTDWTDTSYSSWRVWISCPNCGSLIESIDLYCKHCGFELSKKEYCPTCGKEV